MTRTLALALLVAGGCTSLGPMPATTGVSAVPLGSPGAEVTAAIVPSFYLSSAASDHKGAVTPELSLLVEPDRALGIPGLILGVRGFGGGNDALYEPYLGYRARLDPTISLAGVVYGTETRATDQLATYHATRAGGELAADARIVGAGWFSLHAQAAVSATHIAADGTYCVDRGGVGIDCDTSDTATNRMVDAKLAGVFGAATATLAADFDTHLAHARLAVLGSTGEMPSLTNGIQRASTTYATLGVMLTLGARSE